MEFYEAITNLNILSSYDTEKEKRDKYKECINAILENHNELEKAIRDNQMGVEKMMYVNDRLNNKAGLLEILVMNIIDKLNDKENYKNIIQYVNEKLNEINRGKE